MSEKKPSDSKEPPDPDTMPFSDQHVDFLMHQMLYSTVLHAHILYPHSYALCRTFAADSRARLVKIEESRGVKSTVVLPYCTDRHWRVFIFDTKRKRCVHIDPIGGPPDVELLLLLSDQLLEYTFADNEDVRVQDDDYQCGVWICILAHANIVKQPANVYALTEKSSLRNRLSNRRVADKYRKLFWRWWQQNELGKDTTTPHFETDRHSEVEFVASGGT